MTLIPTTRKFQTQGTNDHSSGNPALLTALFHRGHCHHWRRAGCQQTLRLLRGTDSWRRLAPSRVTSSGGILSYSLSLSLTFSLLSLSTPIICMHVYLHRFTDTLGFILYPPLGSLSHSSLTIHYSFLSTSVNAVWFHSIYLQDSVPLNGLHNLFIFAKIE